MTMSKCGIIRTTIIIISIIIIVVIIIIITMTIIIIIITMQPPRRAKTVIICKRISIMFRMILVIYHFLLNENRTDNVICNDRCLISLNVNAHIKQYLGKTNKLTNIHPPSTHRSKSSYYIYTHRYIYIYRICYNTHTDTYIHTDTQLSCRNLLMIMHGFLLAINLTLI